MAYSSTAISDRPNFAEVLACVYSLGFMKFLKTPPLEVATDR